MAATTEEIVNEIETLKDEMSTRAQESQLLKIEVQALTEAIKAEGANRAADIQKIQKVIEAQYGHDDKWSYNRFREKRAKDFKPELWSGENDKTPFRELYDSMLNWAGALHDQAVEAMEQCQLLDSQLLTARQHLVCACVFVCVRA